MSQLTKVEDKQNELKEPLVSGNEGTTETKEEEEEDPLLDFKVRCLDIFLLLDQQNDNYLSFDETEEIHKSSFLAEQGDAFKEAFDQNAVNDHINIDGFIKILEDLDLKEKVDTIRDQLYDKKFGGCFAKLVCGIFKCLFKKIRNYMVKERYKKNQLSYEEQAIEANKLTRFGMLMRVKKDFTEFLDEATDCLLCYQMYWLAQNNVDSELQYSYKIVFVACFHCIACKFLISYSATVNNLWQLGVYEPEKYNQLNCCQKMYKILYLSAVGPLQFVLIQIINLIRAIILVPLALIGLSSWYECINDSVNLFYEKQFGLSVHLEQGRAVQSAIMQLCFESLPMLILQLLVVYQVIICPEITKGETKQTLLISICTTILSIVTTLFGIYVESRSLDEPFLMYTLMCMKARQGWVPFIKYFRTLEARFGINYGNLVCSFPYLTNWIGLYKSFQFEFDDMSLQSLSAELTLWKKSSRAVESNTKDKDIKYVMVVGQSIEYVSINSALNFLHLAPKDLVNINMIVKDWSNLIKNARNMRLIKQEGDEKYQTKIPSGLPCIWVCVEDEPEEGSEDPWMLEQCLDQLLKDGCDPNVFDVNGQTLLIHTIKHNKMKSFNYLLQNGVDLNMKNNRGQTPLGQAIASMNMPILKILLEKDINLHERMIYDMKVNNKPYSPMHYICKLMRLMCFDDKEDFDENHKIIQIFELFLSRGIYCTTEEEKSGLMRQFSKLSIINWGSNQKKVAKTEMVMNCFARLEKASNFNMLYQKDSKGNNVWHPLCKDVYTLTSLRTHVQKFNNSDNWEDKLRDIAWQPNNAGKYCIENTIENFRPSECWRELFGILIRPFEDKRLEDIMYKHMMNFSKHDYRNSNGPGFQSLTDPVVRCFKFRSREQWHEDIRQLGIETKNKHCLRNIGITDFSILEGDQKDEQDKDGQAGENDDQADNEVGSAFNAINKDGYVRKVHSEDEQKRILKRMDSEIFSKSLTKEDSSTLKMKIANRNAVDKPNEWLAFLFAYVIEILAAVDLAADLMMLYGMVNSHHTMWMTLTIFQMVSPFFVSYVPLINFQLERNSFQLYTNDKQTCRNKILGGVTITPLILVYLQFMDIMYLISSVIFEPIIILLKLFTCGKFDLSCLNDKVNQIYVVMFDMTNMDIAGFRRLRTISQLSFESLPQIFLQTRILIYMKRHPEDLFRKSVSLEAIIISLATAILHFVIEIIYLKMESVSCKTSVMHYSIICFNGRFGWVPFTNLFCSSTGKVASAEERDGVLDFDNITSQFLCAHFSMEFEFSDGTIQGLTKSLSQLPFEQDSTKRFNIKIGQCAQNIKIENLYNLLLISYGRINIDMSDLDIDQMLEASPEFLDQIQHPSETNDKNPIIVQLVKLQLHQMVEKLYQYGPKMDVKDLNGDDLLKIALQLKDDKMINVFMKMNDPYINQQLAFVEDYSSTMTKLVNLKKKTIYRAMFSNNKMPVSPYNQYRILNFGLSMFDVNDSDGYDIINCVCGPNMPDYLLDVQRETDSEGNEKITKRGLLDKVEKANLTEYFETFPTDVHLVNLEKKQKLTVSTIEAFCFSVLRLFLIKEWDIGKDGPKINAATLGTQNLPLNVAEFGDIDLNCVDQIIKMIDLDKANQVPNLKAEDVVQLDKTCETLGLDKFRFRYFRESRRGDQTGSIETFKFNGERAHSRANGESPPKSELVENKDWRYNVIGEFTVPEGVVAIQRNFMKSNLEDQGWGGSGSSNMQLCIFGKNDSLALQYQNIDRGHDGVYPNYNYDDSNQNETFRRPIIINLFSSVTAGDRLVFKIASPPWGGWSAGCNKLECEFGFIKKLD